MNATQVLDHFARISDAPDAVPRLRRFILDLAVRGKLVEQDLNDEPASELLKRIQENKLRLIKEERIRKSKLLETISPSAAPFEIPSSWEWVRLGQVSSLITKGSTPTSYGHSYVQSGINFIKIEAIRDSKLVPENVTSYITKETHDFLKRSQLATGDFLFSIAGSIGTCAIVTEAVLPANTNQALAIIRGADAAFLIAFLRYSTRSSLLESALAKARGGAMNNISLEDVSNLLLSLPPVAEQHRIVAKVDELMALCDRLETAQAERESRRDKLAAASLHRLNNGANAAEFHEHARFHLRHLPRLTTRPEHIQQLRQTILNLAVRGKLVPQDRNDEPACELLKRIQAEKARLLKEGEAKPRKQQRPMTDAGEPFSIPESWRWISLGDIAFGFRYGTSVKCSYEPKGEPVLRIPNVANGRIDIEDLKYGSLSEREADELRLRLDDILIVRSNGSLNLVGRPALVEAQAVGFCYAGYLVRLRTSTVHLDSYYLLLALNTAHVRDQIEIPIRTTVGLKNVNATELSGLTIPLPPVAEQHRVVGKVDELMTLCDRLEAQLTTTQTESRRLLDAVLQESLNANSNT